MPRHKRHTDHTDEVDNDGFKKTMSFLLLKNLHVFFVASSYALFFLRGIWSLNGSAIMRQRWVRIVPHFVDTLLLISALALAYTIGQYPFVDAWLTAKIAGLLLYVGLGFIALRAGMHKSIRIICWLAAQAAFAYIVLVAMSHAPIPWQHLRDTRPTRALPCPMRVCVRRTLPFAARSMRAGAALPLAAMGAPACRAGRLAA